jgi:hypothetical protein
MTNTLTDIGKAVKDLIEEYGIAKENKYVQKPISYALYNTWKSWDKREKPRMTVSSTAAEEGDKT